MNPRSNTAPRFTSQPVESAAVGEIYTYNIVAQDSDPNDTLTISAPTKPAWLNLQGNGDGTATLSGTPATGDAGNHPVELEVSDSGTPRLSATQEFTIEVDQPAETGFQGMVLEEGSGVPIADARISFTSEDGQISETTTSGSNGAYRIVLMEGRYIVTATHPDYEDFSSSPGFFLVTGTGFETGNIFMIRRNAT